MDTDRAAPKRAGDMAEQRAPEARRQKLLAAIAANSALPSVGAAITRIVTTASSEKEDVPALANLIMNDVALTQKTLRVANSISVRGNGAPCTMVSRAIMLMGFETVKSLALSCVLLDMMKNRSQAAVMQKELSQSYLASVLARRMPGRPAGQNVEEVCAAALLKSVGRMLVAAHDFELYQEVKALARTENRPESAAAHRVFAMTYEQLTEYALEQWGLPRTMIAAVARYEAPRGGAKPTPEEWMRAVVGFSAEAADAMAKGPGVARERELAALIGAYSNTLAIDRPALDGMINSASRHVLDAMQGMNLAPVATPELEAEFAPPEEQAAPAASGDASEVTAEIIASELPHAAEDVAEAEPDGHSILLNCLQEVTRFLVSENATLFDAVTLVAEGVYRGLRMDRVLIGILDQNEGCYVTRVALGRNREAMLRRFRIPLKTGQPDLFNAVLMRGADVYLANLAQIQAKLPEWYKRLAPSATSMLLLPVMFGGKAMGFLYADTANDDAREFPPETLALAKTLRGQVALAFKTLRA
jgi:HD-like signal output (HDOD) protein